MLAYQAPHTPVQVADRYWDAGDLAGLTDYNTGIYAMVESHRRPHRPTASRSRSDPESSTTPSSFSPPITDPTATATGMGLRGTKGHVDEGGVRVPFAIRLPGEHPANGQVLSKPAAHIDLLPTLLDLIGHPVPAGLDGVSLRPLLEGADLPDRFVYAFGQGYPYTGYPGSMRDTRYLYVARDSNRNELYDLADDPGQAHDIYGSLPSVGEKMADRYRRFAAAVGRPDRVAPPIDLTGGPGDIRLLAHEGEPLGSARFSDSYGWANDFFVDVGVTGAYWPVVSHEDATYEVTLRYHLDAPGSQTVHVSAHANAKLTADLPVARTHQLPVADRVHRKEVYPRAWAERTLGRLRVPAGSTRLTIGTATQVGAETGLWVKELRLRKVND